MRGRAPFEVWIKNEWSIAPFLFATVSMVVAIGAMIMANVQKSKDGR